MQIQKDESIYGICIDDDDKIILSGTLRDGSVNSVIALRYHATPELTSTQSVTNLADVKIMPNPVSSSEALLDFSLTRPDEITVNLFDTQGKLVQKFWENETMVTGHHTKMLVVSGLSQGLYFLHLKGKQTGTVVKKFIKF